MQTEDPLTARRFKLRTNRANSSKFSNDSPASHARFSSRVQTRRARIYSTVRALTHANPAALEKWRTRAKSRGRRGWEGDPQVGGR